MRIAVVGSTGRIGAKITQGLLAKGHSVRALSRGGRALDSLIELGAEPFIGSFDAGTGDLGAFFEEVDAAFLMVKTLWDGDLHGHYPAVGLRFFDALRDSPVRFAVSLTGMGSEVSGNTGHFQPFHLLDRILDRLRDMDLVHLQGGWFMENLFGWVDSIAQHDRIAWSLSPQVKTPWVAIQDVADYAVREFDTPPEQHRSVRELGTDYSMPEIASIIGQSLGETVDYRFVDRNDRAIEAVFRERFGTLDRWVYDNDTMAALNDGRVRFHDDRPRMPTTMQDFVASTLKPAIQKARADGIKSESFLTWSSQA